MDSAIAECRNGFRRAAEKTAITSRLVLAGRAELFVGCAVSQEQSASRPEFKVIRDNVIANKRHSVLRDHTLYSMHPTRLERNN
jgi:hypothetical protein